MNIEPFSKMRGRDMIALGREGFLAIAPPFTGDILWEHLEILQKGNAIIGLIQIISLKTFSRRKKNIINFQQLILLSKTKTFNYNSNITSTVAYARFILFPQTIVMF